LLRRARPLLVTALIACAGQAEPPTPDQPPATQPPDLTGATVMVLPAQPAPGASVLPDGEPVPGLDREIAYWLGETAPRVTWILPPVLERTLERSPSLGIRLRSLPVSIFHRAQVENIGDPLFGDLNALGALVGARVALLPVSAAYVSGTGGEPGRVELRIALLDPRTGRVLWYGAVAGERGMPEDPATVASAARALAALVAR
jgi:hypothetical protein